MFATPSPPVASSASPGGRLSPSPQPTPTPSPTPELIERLAQSQMLTRDYVAFVSSLRGLEEPVPRVVREAPLTFRIGDQRRFWIGDVDISRNYQITATLRVQTAHVQMWVQDEAAIDQDALERSAQAFEERIYPTDHRYFGSEWDPGIDGDSHLVVLSALFSGAAGYFASANEYSRLVNPYSNEQEMFVMNLKALDPGTPEYEAVLAHEFQHMIHWYQDSNEDAWVSEGASELAEDLNGYTGPQAALREFENQPDVQLNTWDDEHGDSIAHYGASYLMLRYFLDRFGPEALRELIQEPGNGLTGFEATLARRSSDVTFDELFADWLVANTLDDPQVDEGRFGYVGLDVHVKSQYQVRNYPHGYQGTVHQYAADYFELLPAGTSPLSISFSGTSRVKVIPNEPTSGRYQWWSNRGDSSHSYLERSFDLTHVQTATLTFNLWYDIESGWDYAYVRASTDGGRSWQLLRGAYMTDYNPNGNALGPGYSGKSGAPAEEAAIYEPAWVREELDLSAYCRQKVLLRFDYITDDAVNKPGLCLDDLELAAVGFKDDVESGEDGWIAQGFIRHDNVLPQHYLVQLIEFGQVPSVRQLLVSVEGQGAWLIKGFGDEVQRALLIISAITPGTTEMAEYNLQLEQLTQARDEGLLLLGQDGAQVKDDSLILNVSHDGRLAVAQCRSQGSSLNSR